MTRLCLQNVSGMAPALAAVAQTTVGSPPRLDITQIDRQDQRLGSPCFIWEFVQAHSRRVEGISALRPRRHDTHDHTQHRVQTLSLCNEGVKP